MTKLSKLDWEKLSEIDRRPEWKTLQKYFKRQRLIFGEWALRATNTSTTNKSENVEIRTYQTIEEKIAFLQGKASAIDEITLLPKKAKKRLEKIEKRKKR